MADWLITVHRVDASDVTPEFKTLRTVRGTREEAVAALRAECNTYAPHVSKLVRREVFEYLPDRAYLVRTRGRFGTVDNLIALLQKVADTADPELPDGLPGAVPGALPGAAF
ncbi:hypothetical protein KNE206_14260 [Kitasatospora sp. NE20-6]|uniref:hypothetical protein n=1 Tax=Kitasatospora sp. NE20-6 TaxID=2859066 RepID=UPI0034DCA6F3